MENREKTRVLVTGAGSGVGQGIIKALRISKLSLTVMTSDISPLNCGLYRADESILLPKSEDPESLPKICEALTKAKIDVLMVGSEYDLKFFATHKETIEKETGALIIVSPLETVKIAEDKWLTAEFLKSHNLPFAQAYLPKNLEDALEKSSAWKYPLMIKTRVGTSSRHVHVLKNESELKNLYASVPSPMLQKMISTPSAEIKNEYTCSIFKCREGDILGPFTARRSLRGGSSWVVEVAPFEELYSLLTKIAENLPTMASLNVQLMKGDDGVPTPFEFNARFSGTTSIRAHFGFNEPEMAIKNFYLKESLTQPVIGSGVALRYLEDVFIDHKTIQSLQPPFSRGEIHPWF